MLYILYEEGRTHSISVVHDAEQLVLVKAIASKSSTERSPYKWLLPNRSTIG